jgi:DNA-binding LacI/PurR family transcriptional regulator
VSVATVSRVINNDPCVSHATRNLVLKAANQTRYVPKMSMRSTMNIALLYTDEPSLDSTFDSALMRGMGQRLEEFGFDLLVLLASRSCLPGETYTQMLMRKGARGVVIRTTSRTREICEQIASEGFPAVVVGDRFDNPNVCFVSSDSRSGSRDAVAHLIKLGHRRIAICTNVVDDSDHTDRVQGYTDAMLAAGLAIDPMMVVRSPAHREGGKQFVRRMWAGSDVPTAVYMADPLAAMGAIHELANLGIKVPHEVSVVGFDDGELRQMVQPTMTAVCQDAAAVGREAFAVLNSIVETGEKIIVRQRVLPTFLEIHDSTAPVRKA